jgi:hypothetical protein
VVEELNIHRLRPLPQLAGHLNVGRRRRRVAGWMIVLCGVPSYVQ